MTYRSEGYRCDVCRRRASRCGECRARRRAVVRARRARWRKAGRCVMCGAPRASGLVRCVACRDDNRVRSLRSHVEAARRTG